MRTHGRPEDDARYAILRRDWQRLYAGIEVEVVA
jgi:hypothetical protein